MPQVPVCKIRMVTSDVSWLRKRGTGLTKKKRITVGCHRLKSVSLLAFK